MKRSLSPKTFGETAGMARAAEAIVQVQREDGEIPWSEVGKTDPWDHVESAMGLAVGGYVEQARRAFRWSARRQMEDGSWFSGYREGRAIEDRKDPNMSAYIAVGLFHHYLITHDILFMRQMWPTVCRAIDFAVSMQAPDGQIHWAKFPDGTVESRALLTGSSSIYMSLKCAVAIAARLGINRPSWEFAMRKLGEAIRHRRDLFDDTKSRYSMDWYYPVLCGAVSGQEAAARIARGWDTFVVENWGVRCVADRPWVTMAETSELILALSAAGIAGKAEAVFQWIKDCRYEDGFYWTGVTFPDSVIWPEEKTTWTAGAVILAGDALHGWTRGCKLFSHDFWAVERSHSRAHTPRARRGMATRDKGLPEENTEAA